MPQIGVHPADEQIQQEKGQEEHLDPEDVPFPLAEPGPQVLSLPPGGGSGRQEQDAEHPQEGAPPHGDARRAEQPGAVSEEQHPGQAGQGVAAVS